MRIKLKNAVTTGKLGVRLRRGGLFHAKETENGFIVRQDFTDVLIPKNLAEIVWKD